MKGKRITFLFISIFIIIAVGGYFGIKYLREKTSDNQIKEYVPQEEINDQQYRQTIVTLYFKNKENNEIATEARLIDASKLINNPYNEIVSLLIQGPKNEKLERLIPENVKVNSCTIKDNCVTIDFSKEFLNYNNDEELKNKIINSIVNTLTELTEVNSIKILIDGNQNDNFKDVYVRI